MATEVLGDREREALLGLRRHGAERLPTPSERRAIRASAGVAVDELTAVVGVSAASVYAWELGIRNPGRTVRDRYREALRILEGEA